MANPQHLTLAAATPATATLDADYNEVEVVNVDGAAAVYFTTDGSTPVVAGNGSHVVPAAVGGFVTVRPRTTGATVVKLISSAIVKVSVRGVIS